MSIKFKITKLGHEGGTKDYHMILLTGDKKHYLIKRWGKTGRGGTVRIQQMATEMAGVRYIQKTIKSKERKGYCAEVDTHLNLVESAHEVRSAVEPVDRQFLNMLNQFERSGEGLEFISDAEIAPMGIINAEETPSHAVAKPKEAVRPAEWGSW